MEGWTRLLNKMLTALQKVKMTHYEKSVFWVIYEKTERWHKELDWISYGQFEKAVGIDKRDIPKIIRKLEKRNIITVDKSNSQKPGYGIQKDFKKWVLSPS